MKGERMNHGNSIFKKVDFPGVIHCISLLVESNEWMNNYEFARQLLLLLLFILGEHCQTQQVQKVSAKRSVAKLVIFIPEPLPQSPTSTTAMAEKKTSSP